MVVPAEDHLWPDTPQQNLWHAPVLCSFAVRMHITACYVGARTYMHVYPQAHATRVAAPTRVHTHINTHKARERKSARERQSDSLTNRERD